MLVLAVHKPSLRQITLADYLQLVHSVFELSPRVGHKVRIFADWVIPRFGFSILGVSMTHGDFQDANILVSGQIIKIIDWETATIRSQFYDFATLVSGIRLSSDRFVAWSKTLDFWLKQPSKIPDLIIPIDSRNSMLYHAIIWWLEELIFQLEEVRSGYQSETDDYDDLFIGGVANAMAHVEQLL